MTAVSDLLALYRAGADPCLADYCPELPGRVREAAAGLDLDYTLLNVPNLLSRARNGLRRIRQIVVDLRTFARLDQDDVLQEEDLNAVVASAVNLVAGAARERGVLVELAPGSIPPVPCRQGRINQVVMNLLSNAMFACGAGGRVTVGTRPAGPGHVEVVVADDCCGIDPGVRDRIFDPFFTTRPPGQGAGLGLSISCGIVRAHGGAIAVESAPGRGATFAVRLPLNSAGINGGATERHGGRTGR